MELSHEQMIEKLKEGLSYIPHISQVNSLPALVEIARTELLGMKESILDLMEIYTRLRDQKDAEILELKDVIYDYKHEITTPESITRNLDVPNR